MVKGKTRAKQYSKALSKYEGRMGKAVYNRTKK